MTARTSRPSTEPEQTALAGLLDWSEDSRVDSERLRSLPPATDWRQEEIERRIHHLETEARALVRSIAWLPAHDGGWRPRGELWFGIRRHLLKYIGNAMLITRAPHMTDAKRVRLLDEFDACFAWARANLDADFDSPRREYGSKRFSRVVRDLARVAPMPLAAVGNRDGWTCGLCLLPVLRRAPRWLRTHPLAASIDHVVPLSRGGADDCGNVRLAHGLCNSLRHDDREDRRLTGSGAPPADTAISAVLTWEREYAGDYLEVLRRWLQLEGSRRRRADADQVALELRLRRQVATEEARLADPLSATWDRPSWYLDLVRGALVGRAEERGFCVTCLLQSPWLGRPRLIRHRRPGFHDDRAVADAETAP